MNTGKILVPSIVGTSAMTLFSYIVSDSKNENFREPEVLAQLIARLPKGITKDPALVAGWVTHYAVGILFVFIYNKLWQQTQTGPSITNGALLGVVSGVAGIIVWKGAFATHPKPPAKNLNKFFGHLLLAHVVFGVFSALGYKLSTSNKNPK